jgi:hypothetical protein
VTPAEYYDSHAIDPQVAEWFGVRCEGGALVFPYGGFQRHRPLDGNVVFQPKGHPLKAWTPIGTAKTVLVCEGEGDTLAAASAMFDIDAEEIRHDYFRGMKPIGIPGASMNVDRLAETLKGDDTQAPTERAFVVMDADDAGRKALERITWGLMPDVKVIPVHLPDGMDLADWLVDRDDRADALANLLADHECLADDECDDVVLKRVKAIVGR